MKRRHFVKGMGLYLPALALPFGSGLPGLLPKITGDGTDQPPCNTACQIPDQLAQKRETNYASWKLPVLNGTCPDNSENISLPVNPTNFLNMLQQFASSGQAGQPGPVYNGIRVYFAACDQGVNTPPDLPADQNGKLTVIFVPTKPDPAYPQIGGDDDLSQCWWLYQNIQFNFPMRDPNNPAGDSAKRWVYNYRNNKRDGANGLNAKGASATGNTGFVDTCCIWYKMPTIVGSTVGGQTDCGMIGYISKGLASATDPIDSMKIGFGAYDSSEKTNFPYYQLLAQFDFHQKTSNTYFQLGSVAGQSRGAKHKPNKVHPFDGTTDTGLPCPPADPCNGTGFGD